MKHILVKVDGKNSFNGGIQDSDAAEAWLKETLSKNNLGEEGALKEGVEIIRTDKTEDVLREEKNAEAYSFLHDTDFKVLRHLRQKALGIPLSLSEEEYLALEQERHDASLRIID